MTQAQTQEAHTNPTTREPVAPTDPNECPCGTGSPYANCCKPIISGKQKAKTAEELMRARYSAFVKSEVDFILASHHPKTRGDVKKNEIEEWAKSSKWMGLVVHEKEAGGPNDNQGVVIFHARYEAIDPSTGSKTPKVHEHWERAQFEKVDGNWMFLDAQGIQHGPIKRTEPKTGRNDPCPCGSGKKFKKCHAA